MNTSFMAQGHFVAKSKLTQTSVLMLALVLSLPAWSQSGGTSGSSSGSSSTESSGMAGSRSASRSSVPEEARETMEDLAHANLAEIDLSRTALDKAQNPQVKRFAQQMIDDHTQALQELQQIGQKKQLTLPTETDFQHKAIGAALHLLSGATYEKQYLRQAGINDHRRTVDLLQKAQRSTDADLKAYAGKMLPIVQRHLNQARDLERQMK